MSVKSWIEDKQLRWGSYWGVYKIKGDTLVMYKYDEGGFWKGWSLYEYRYKILDSKTIQRIYIKGLLKADEESNKLYNFDTWRNDDPSIFVPADSLPSSDCWLKEEKWIWRNESDWRDYMQKIERKKIRK